MSRTCGVMEGNSERVQVFGGVVIQSSTCTHAQGRNWHYRSGGGLVAFSVQAVCRHAGV